ncbi:MAG: hypothetical protein ACRCZI_07695, partial [Cetobacterium sp.]
RPSLRMKPLANEQAADLAELTTRGLAHLKNSEDPPPRSANGFVCKDFGQWLKRRHLRGLGIDQDGKRYDFDSERARLTHHQANKVALEERTLSGELIHSSTVAQVWGVMASNFRARMLALPSKAAPLAVGNGDVTAIEKIVMDLVKEALTELADYDPQQYAAAIDSPPDGGDAKPTEAPARPERKRLGRPRKTP